jgi:hypothetical protein
MMMMVNQRFLRPAIGRSARRLIAHRALLSDLDRASSVDHMQ